MSKLLHSEEAKKYQQFYREQLLDDVVPFWMNSDLLDSENGGYISSVDRQGKSYNDDKSVWFQGRCLWTFSTLCEKYGIREEWKQAADSGKKFLEEKCIDSDGRMFFTVTKEGKPLRKRRYLFSESFFVVSMAEYGYVFHDADALQKAEKCFDMMMQIYEDPNSDPFKITPKSYAETRNERSAAVPMVLVSSAQLLRRCDAAKADYYSKIVARVTNDILRYHFHPELKASLENVLIDGNHVDNPSGRTINPGHSCENAWFLMSEAVYSGDNELLNTALEIFDIAFERGWDKEFGGMLYFVDLDGRPCEQLEWDMKLWWVHNEVLIASLMAYSLTGDEKYWDRFEMVHEYSFSHFSDTECGEWYGYLHRDGTVSHTQKGSLWKGPYHLPRCLMLCDELLGRIAEGKAGNPLL
ncbi:MAG: AGE family epimerase/isomerase [Clostridia bacterium]|nr:AGE family epimerase/isomerase [Clostridia bacterium]